VVERKIRKDRKYIETFKVDVANVVRLIHPTGPSALTVEMRKIVRFFIARELVQRTPWTPRREFESRPGCQINDVAVH